jgi:hypothetical protein
MKTLARHQSRLSSLMLITFVLQNFIFPSLLLAVENNVAPKAIPVPEDLPITGNTAPALRAEVVQEAPLPYKAPWLNDTVARSQELNDALMNFKKIDLVASSGDSSESCSGDRTLNQHKAIAKLEALIRLYTNPEKSGFVDNFKIPTQDAGLYQKLYEATDRSVRGDSSGPSVQTVLLELQKYKAKERFQNLENHFVEESKNKVMRPLIQVRHFKLLRQCFKILNQNMILRKFHPTAMSFLKTLNKLKLLMLSMLQIQKLFPRHSPQTS